MARCSRTPSVFDLSYLTLFSLTLLLCTGDELPQHYCGSSLTDALFSVCKNFGFATHFTPRSSETKQTKLGGIIEECCKNPCSKQHLSQYCDKKLATIPISKKRRKESPGEMFRITNRVVKRKRSPSSCTCGNRISKGLGKKKNQRRRFPKSHPYEYESTRFAESKSVGSTTTEKQIEAEAHYIDDWTGGEDFVSLNHH